MFRITDNLRVLLGATTRPPAPKPTAPVVIWNLIRRCNLTCKHCYSISADKDFSGELSTQEVYRVLSDLKQAGVRVLILSGGEPLLRADLLDISHRAKEMGFYVGLSSNGTLITQRNIKAIAEVDYDYVGVSIDGLRETHDVFRRMSGAYDAALNGMRLCRDQNIKVGMRFTLTQDNAADLPALLALMRQERFTRFYLSHLNYAGRGNKNKKYDVQHQVTREHMQRVFDVALEDAQRGGEMAFVSGNNDADAVFFLLWLRSRFPERFTAMRERLAHWGGNASGVNIANIDNLGEVHPDTFWWHHNLGNVRQRRFAQIWADVSDPLMAGLKSQPRPLKGRCGACRFVDVCNGNTRVRAYQLTGDPWQADPACYLSDQELGIDAPRRIAKPVLTNEKLNRVCGDIHRDLEDAY